MNTNQIMKSLRWIGIAAVILLPLPGMCQGYVKIQQKAEAYSGARLLSVTNTHSTIWATSNPSTTTGRVLYRGIQNTGTNALLYLIVTPGTVATNVSSTNFTGVLAGGLAPRDGLGSMVDLSRSPWPVSVATESGSTTISVVELTQ